jgi:hypothetical protein
MNVGFTKTLLLLHIPKSVTSFATVPSSTHPMLTKSRAKTTPKALLATHHSIPSPELDPTTYAQASKHHQWREIMTTELDALAKDQT